jgi:hypothetical protein
MFEEGGLVCHGDTHEWMSDVMQQTMNYYIDSLTCIHVIEYESREISRERKHLGSTVVSNVLRSSIWKYMEIHTDA